MFRQRIANNDAVDDNQFVARLYGLPVVTSAVGQLSALYTGTKERNRLFRFTLETAESGLGIAVRSAMPIVLKFEKPIGSLNDLACQKLVKFENDYPIITKPTNEVIKVTKETCTTAVKPITDRVGSALETVKPITDRVGAVTRYSFDKANGVKVYAFDTVEGLRTYSVGKIHDVGSFGAKKVEDVRVYGCNKLTSVAEFGSKSADRLLDNRAGRLVVAKMNQAIQLADHYVDLYLPEDGDCIHNDDKSADQGGQLDGYKIVATRAADLSYKVGHRTHARVSKRLRNLKLRSLETVNKLNFTVDLMEWARNNLNSVRSKTESVWEEINKSVEESAEEVTENERVKMNLTYERRAIATARQLTQRLKANLAGFNLSMDLLPAVIRDGVDHAVHFTQSLLNTFSSRTRLSEAEINGAKSFIRRIRGALLSIKAWIPSSLKPAFVQLVGADDESLLSENAKTGDAKTGDQEEKKVLPAGHKEPVDQRVEETDSSVHDEKHDGLHDDQASEAHE